MEQDARKQDKEQEAWLRLPSVSATCLARWRLVFYSKSSCRLECFHSGATSRARMFVERVSNRSAVHAKLMSTGRTVIHDSSLHWAAPSVVAKWTCVFIDEPCSCFGSACIGGHGAPCSGSCNGSAVADLLFALCTVRAWISDQTSSIGLLFVAGVPRVLSVVPSIGLPAAQRDKLRPTRCRHCILAFHFAYMRVMFAKHWTLPSECLMSWCSWW